MHSLAILEYKVQWHRFERIAESDVEAEGGGLGHGSARQNPAREQLYSQPATFLGR